MNDKQLINKLDQIIEIIHTEIDDALLNNIGDRAEFIIKKSIERSTINRVIQIIKNESEENNAKT